MTTAAPLMGRRKLILSASMLPVLASCASNFEHVNNMPLSELASHLGIGATSYATLKNGHVDELVSVSGQQNQRPHPADTVFQAASLTKPLVAYAALELVLARELELNAPVSHYLPRGYLHFHRLLARQPQDAHDIMPPSVLSRISIGSLLNHSSGLPNWSDKPMTLDFEPGTRWQYSGEGYMLLQSVLEAVTGQSLDNWMASTVFAPLGMTRSSLVWHERLDSQVLTIAQPGFWSPRPAKISQPLAAASLYASALDFAQFMCAVLRQKSLIALTLSSPVMVNQALGIEWGHGWGIERGKHGVKLWQWGNNPGFRSFAMCSLESGNGFVALTNHHQGMVMAERIAQQALPGEHKAFRFFMVG